MLYLGTHLGKETGKSGFYNIVCTARNVNINSVQIFTKPPIKVSDIKTDSEDLKLTKEILKETKIFLVIHGQYIINFCKNPQKQMWSIKSVVDDMNLLNNLSNKLLPTGVILHMGKNTTKLSKLECINNFKESLELILSKVSVDNNINIILETSVRSSNDIFYKIEDLAELYNKLKQETRNKVKFCIDSCHIFASGYNIADTTEMKNYFEKFDKLIGLSNISVIHLNDSKEICNSGKDRHQEISKGHIFNKDNLENLRYLVKDISMKYNIPLITETASEDLIKELEFIKNSIK